MALVVAHRCLVIAGGNGSLPSSTPFLVPLFSPSQSAQSPTTRPLANEDDDRGEDDATVRPLANEDGDRGEDDATVRPLANEDGDRGEDDATAQPLANEDGDRGENDVTTLSEDGVDRPKDDSSGSDDDGDQDNRGAASKDSNDEIMSTGTEVFQLLPIRANYRIHAINGCDWISG
jgi:hypothetical protein